MSGKAMTNSNNEKLRFLLVGIGPHAKRTFIKHLKVLDEEGRAELVAAIDVVAKQSELEEYAARVFPGPELVFVPMFRDPMPHEVATRLTTLVERLRIDCVIISTEPECHKAYGLWALSLGLNVIMDKPITTRKHAVTSMSQAVGIADDYDELLTSYQTLQSQKSTFFLINSHRRYHPGFHGTIDMIKEMREKVGNTVTNIVSTHCDGQWRVPTEILNWHYHPFKYGYGKVSHSGYHFMDTTYLFMKAGWSIDKRPDAIEVVSGFLMPSGYIRGFTREEHRRIFGSQQYDEACQYSDEELRRMTASMGEIDAVIQFSFKQKNDVVATAQLSLLHTGFSRRNWLHTGVDRDLYKGVGRVKHEAHEIRSGPFQTIVIDSRQANDKHDRSKPSTAERGSDNHFEVVRWLNCDVFGESEPLKVYTVNDLDRQYNTELPGIYSENVKRGILWEAVANLKGEKPLASLSSNLPDHSIPATLMSAAYVSHVRRTMGLNPVTHIDLSYSSEPEGAVARAKIRSESLILPRQPLPTPTPEHDEVGFDVLASQKRRYDEESDPVVAIRRVRTNNPSAAAECV